MSRPIALREGTLVPLTRPAVLSILVLAAWSFTPPLHAQSCPYAKTIAVQPVEGWVQVEAGSSGNVVRFNVTNTTPNFEGCEYEVQNSLSWGGPVFVDNWGPTSFFYLWPGETGVVEVVYTAGTPGSGWITLTAQVIGGFNPPSADGTNSIDVVPAQGPVISLADYHQSARDVGKCVVNCFDAVASYSTPPYYSGDIPRAVQLVYRSALARPMVFVQLGAWDTTATYPTKMSVQLKNAQGVNATFTNDSTEFFFSCPSAGGYYACDSTTNRLAVQFDATTNGLVSTGAYSYTAIVRSYRPGGGFVESKQKVRILIQNEASSPFGAGWTIAGYQRYSFVGDSLVITDGNGSIGFFPVETFPCGTSCTYTSPAGDFSKVTKGNFDNGAIYSAPTRTGRRSGMATVGCSGYGTPMVT